MAEIMLQTIPTITSIAEGDKIPFTSAPGGTPVSKNITVENLLNYYDSRRYDTLELANTAAYNDGKLLVIAKNHTLTANTVLTASVMVIPGGSFTKASTYTLTINGSFSNPSNGQCFIGFAAGDVTFGAGVVNEFRAEWFDLFATDLGGTINMILAGNVNGCEIKLPGGTLPSLTQINLDLLHSRASIKITGQGTTNEPTGTLWGTVIDGSGMAVPIMVGAQTKVKSNIILRDFVIKGGTSDGLVIGTATYTSEFSTFENIAVQNADGWGIKIYNSYGSYLNQLYANQCGDGIYLYQMNAAHIGILISRENLGTTCPYAIDILHGQGVDIGLLYIESNAKGSLRIGGFIVGVTIGTIYSEGNNSGNTAAYEILLGDYSVSNLTTQDLTIYNYYAVAAIYDYTQAVIGISYATNLDLSFTNYWAPAIILKFVTNTKTNTPIILRNCASSTSTIDFSNAYADGGIITIIGGSLEASVITKPTNTQIHTIGGVASKIGQLFDKSVTAAGATSVGVNDRYIYCNTTLGAQTITLPDPSYADGLNFFIVKVTGDANAVTVAGTTYGVVGTSSLPAQWNGASYRYNFITYHCVTLNKNF